MRTLHCLLVAPICAVALTHGANANEEAWRGNAGYKAASTGISREAQEALVCQVVSDWSAFQVTKLIRDDAKESHAVDPQGIAILRQIRLTEGLASIAFDRLAPEADHDAIYKDAVVKMQVYLNDDRDGADVNARRTVTVCQQTYQKMASDGALTTEQVQKARNASLESVAKLTEDLEAEGYSAQP